MTVNVTKPQINVREKLSELDKPSGIAGEAILRSETPQEVFNYINAGRRNLIINGAMQVAQRGTSKTATSDATFLLDRFLAYSGNQSLYGYTVSQSTDAPTGFSSSLKYNFDDADTTPSTEHSIYYYFEGQDLQHLSKGSSSAKQVTLSFWCKASLSGTYIAELMDTDNSNRHINKAYTIDSADTWEYKTITFDADTTGAFDNDNNKSLSMAFWLAASSGNTSGTLQTSWGTLTQANRAVGQTNLGASANNAFYITGVQLEVGKVATPFEHRSYGEELALCQRYAYVTEGSVGSGGVAITTTQPHIHIQYPVIMRSAPSASLNTSGSFKISDDYSADKTASSLSVGVTNSTNFKSRIRVDGFSGLTVGRFYAPDGNSSTTAKILFDAEL